MKEATNSYKSLNTILPYFNINKEDYWHVDYKILNFEPINYYWDLSRKYLDFAGEFDESGIPLYLGADGNKYHSVIFLGHFALGAFQEYVNSNSESSKKDFLRICDWLIDNIENSALHYGIWLNKYPMALFKLENSWSSGLAQAKGISCLVRAFHLTKQKKYLSTAIMASKMFSVARDEGGLLAEVDGMYVIEEYTTTQASCVLNGHIFAIWSIYDILLFEEFVESKEVERLKGLYEILIESLASNLERWDNGFWSKYDIWSEHNNISSLFYHDLHIKQLVIMWKMTGKAQFIERANKWSSQRGRFSNRMIALFSKVTFRLRGRL
ncbi:hypothetical protein C4G56_RS18455 [Vibrio parahaemolyticus]|nr:hypothetical protein [Vibrio parahaemolyticus]EHH1247033.1 hypothetical protein [Vibrio parahaemolyticus]EHH2419991.1 hypothetical protein [Vibrio parahaemolyticus]EHH2557989.1 hypothetical protein [Vibrio parahaemolyticus]EHU4956636.1 hypothetical protein [Vibrio parahaemolyticus]